MNTNSNTQQWIIDQEKSADIEGIRTVNVAAFGRTGEADVVDLLRKNCLAFYSFVARIDRQVVGHILFTPVQITNQNKVICDGLGLAPLAVLPEFQAQGIGSALCRFGLDRIQGTGAPFVIVLGHPSYYPRFGFVPASQYGIKCIYEDVPSDAFMIRIFSAEKMQPISGIAHYRPEFDAVT